MKYRLKGGAMGVGDDVGGLVSSSGFNAVTVPSVKPVIGVPAGVML
jgi:hypothetical protein